MSRRAKIVCTLGPATAGPECLAELVAAGLDVARLNISHGSHDTHLAAYRAVRAASDAAGRSVGILVDLQGPKIRLGTTARRAASAAGLRPGAALRLAPVVPVVPVVPVGECPGWDSNPHWMVFEATACCRLGYRGAPAAAAPRRGGATDANLPASVRSCL
jgi:hypothetical protein